MIEWLLFDGINAEASAATIGRQFHLTFDVLADKAESSITRFQATVSWAKVAGNSAVVCEVPPFSGNESAGIGFTRCLSENPGA